MMKKNTLTTTIVNDTLTTLLDESSPRPILSWKLSTPDTRPFNSPWKRQQTTHCLFLVWNEKYGVNNSTQIETYLIIWSEK